MIHLKGCTGHWREDWAKMVNCNCAERVRQHNLALAEKVREACMSCIVRDGNPMVALDRMRALSLEALLEAKP